MSSVFTHMAKTLSRVNYQGQTKDELEEGLAQRVVNNMYDNHPKADTIKKIAQLVGCTPKRADILYTKCVKGYTSSTGVCNKDSKITHTYTSAFLSC